MPEISSIAIILAAGIITYICCAAAERKHDEGNDDK